MAIEIVNITPDRTSKEPHGYSLRVNGQEVAQFSHRRNLGLGACLREAGIAADRAAIQEGK